MLFRTICRFSGTEDAQRAARIIKEKIENVYEIKMKYRSITNDNDMISGELNVVKYSGENNYSYPDREGSSLFYKRLDGSSGVSRSEYSRECELSVLSGASEADGVRRIMINNGGFGIVIYSENARIL